MIIRQDEDHVPRLGSCSLANGRQFHLGGIRSGPNFLRVYRFSSDTGESCRQEQAEQSKAVNTVNHLLSLPSMMRYRSPAHTVIGTGVACKGRSSAGYAPAGFDESNQSEWTARCRGNRI
jgi:hypothetical protein